MTRLAKVRWKVVLADQTLLGNHKGVFEGAFELAHVSRPRIGHQEVERLGCDPGDRLAAPAAQPLKKPLDKEMISSAL